VNAGQDCTAATRVYVHEKVHDVFLDKVVDKARRIRVGDPSKQATDMGPLVSEPQLRKVEEMVSAGRAEGAKLVLGMGDPRCHLLSTKGSSMNPRFSLEWSRI
jgi:betaine-aldehyde dehydrogenase